MSSAVLLERSGPVATITLNRPESLNTLDFAMIDALVDVTTSVAKDDALRVVVLQGAGRHFMAGGDIKTFAAELAKSPGERQAVFSANISRLHAAIELMQRMPHPVIGRVQGAVAGFGLSLMAACDLVIATDDAYFSSAYRHIGLTPDGGGTWALPRIVGTRKAMEILLLSERFDAAEALRIGLVNKVVAADRIDAVVATIALSIASGPRMALRNIKRLVRDSLDRSLSEQLAAEARSFGACAANEDFVEGINAFLTKREPRFDRDT